VVPVATLAVLGCVYLFFSLSTYTITLFFSWAAIGLVVYYAYGYRNSNVARGIIETHEGDEGIPPLPVPPIQ